MHPALQKNLFLVKEHVGMFKAANNYDVYDPETGEMLMTCREENLGIFSKIFRFTDYKRMTPFDVEIKSTDGSPILSVRRGITFMRSSVEVVDGAEQPLGCFEQKWFSLGGAFRVMTPQGTEVCTLKGKWTGWDFRFMAGDQELAHVTKKWAGLGKELFTSADNYVLKISDSVPPDHVARQLIIASVMCIDMVLKE